MHSDLRSIYIDLDDVLCQAARHFLVVIEREFGKKVNYEQLTNFDIGTSCCLRSDEREKLYRTVHEPDELLKMAPIAEAISMLDRWSNAGYEIAIVTGRPPAAYEASLAWLKQHRVAYHSLTMVDKYSRFETADTVAISLDELAARAYRWAVEDSLPMARYLAERMKVSVALIDCPWNRTDSAHGRISRYRHWREIGEAFPTPSIGDGRCGL